MATKDLFKAN
jgi:hypothetical protein